jgi:hypothetical protein
MGSPTMAKAPKAIIERLSRSKRIEANVIMDIGKFALPKSRLDQKKRNLAQQSAGALIRWGG